MKTTTMLEKFSGPCLHHFHDISNLPGYKNAVYEFYVHVEFQNAYHPIGPKKMWSPWPGPIMP